MSEENVELTRRAYVLFNERDYDALLALGHPDIEWRPLLAQLGGEALHGVAAVRSYMESLAGEWEEFRVEPRAFREVGDAVLVFLRVFAQGKESGAEIEVDTVNVVTFREGKIWRMRGFRDSREALEAVGLSE